MQIDILLATYNAQRFIKEQLESILNQTFSDWNLIVYDDGSNDDTLSIINAYVNRYPEKIKFINNDNRFGSALGSFSFLLTVTNSQYVMFCDQDDVWQSDKIEKTLKKMQEMEKKHGNIPLLVHANLTVVDKHLSIISDSLWQYQNIDPKKDTLNRFLLDNTVTGCTMMINRALALQVNNIPRDVIMHDWYIAMTSSVFGKIAYVDEPLMFYRQHSKNDTGAKQYGWRYFVNKFLRKPSFDKYTLQAKAFLEIYDDQLDDKDKEMLIGFSNIHQMNWFQRRVFLFRHQIFKNGLARNIGLFLWIQ